MTSQEVIGKTQDKPYGMRQGGEGAHEEAMSETMTNKSPMRVGLHI